MGIFDHLPTLAEMDAQRRAIPRHQIEPRVRDRVKARKERDGKASTFRAAVWARDGSKCRLCGRKVTRTLTLCAEQGHVHHIRGRRVAPEDVYNSAKALLLCGLCHHDVHVGAVSKP